MKFTSITLIFTAISAIAIYVTYEGLKRETIGIRSGLVWFALWFGIGFFSLFPGLLNTLMHLAQMQNRMFFILLTAVFILFSLVFNMNYRMEKMQRTISRLAQELAITNYKLEKEKNRNTSCDNHGKK